jgi:uncharacterized protein
MSRGLTLLVLAKEPRPGRVKTRLCPPCTMFEAAEIATAALADTLSAVRGCPAARRVLVLDGRPGTWLPDGFDVVRQSTGGLDVRLAAAFALVPGPALLIGMDTPQVTAPFLAHAAARLPSGLDAVLGLAADGGFWCIGLREPDPRVFLGVPMSTAFTGAAQLHRLDQLGLRAGRLPQLVDVDRFTDAVHVAAMVPRSSFARAVALVERRTACRDRDQAASA